jgi:hypothetical protein
MAVDQKPVEKPIDEISADQHKHDRAHVPHALEIAAKSSVKQQGQRAPT